MCTGLRAPAQLGVAWAWRDACNALKSRINRLMNKHGNVAEDWTNVTDQEKKEFYAKYQDLHGPDLLRRLQETITESKKTSSVVSFEGTGEYFDEVDLVKTQRIRLVY